MPAWLPETVCPMVAAWDPAEVGSFAYGGLMQCFMDVATFLQMFVMQEHPWYQGNAYTLYHNNIRSSLVRAYHLGVQHALMSCRCKR